MLSETKTPLVTAFLAMAFLDELVLGALEAEPSHGYGIVRRLPLRARGVGAAAVYPVLRRLEREGLVTSRPTTRSRLRPRRVYRITRSGSEALMVRRLSRRTLARAAA